MNYWLIVFQTKYLVDYYSNTESTEFFPENTAGMRYKIMSFR
jgi:hypothetical protein